MSASFTTSSRPTHRSIRATAADRCSISTGELIGINTAIYAKAQGIGFAIPINKAKRIIADLIQYGHVIQAWIGLVVQDLDARMAAYLGIRNIDGVVVTQVEDRSPAAEAGVESGDLIVTMGRRAITSVSDYFSSARSLSAGEAVSFKVLRDTRPKEISIRTRAYPQKRVPELAWRRLGIKVRDLNQKIRRRFRIRG